jgi:hypothetical protein
MIFSLSMSLFFIHLNHTLSLSCQHAVGSYSHKPPLCPCSKRQPFCFDVFMGFSYLLYQNIAPWVKQGDLCAVHIVPTCYRAGPDTCDLFRKWWGWKDLWRVGYITHSQLMLCFWFCHEFSWSWISGFWTWHLGIFDQYEKAQLGTHVPVNDYTFAELEKMRKYLVDYFLRYQSETPFLACYSRLNLFIWTKTGFSTAKSHC